MTRKEILEKTIDFDDAIHRIVRLEKENAELKARLNAINLLTPELEKQSKAKKEQLTKARELILKLYNAGRDVLMCRTDEKAYDNLSEAIDDKGIEQFLEYASQSKWVNPVRTTNDNQIKLSEVENDKV